MVFVEEAYAVYNGQQPPSNIFQYALRSGDNQSVKYITPAFLLENFNYYKATDSYNCPSGAILQALAHGTIKKAKPMKRVAVLKLIAFALVTNNFQAFYN